ncbi:uncharacterized protein LACBIDRAFT_293699 [Laccaria bicolor S238N-H82]|uniref:Predicted protein n=1 Tax=Laccaria bicolor (strain S238N-H82 / ATCC MYA-4686) TaxID=486041 RepID=B0D5M8_LACBS|nr:uncharacterized protein LACBIDRAFT_293699 [Laccaria bicolor S238N-H82]EDR09802.1 predicted protein [Laccaria bicolor S238N-H82]|eukprot:XP_001879187.1 predicted protein [Laccaria bicolor S238N-H82]
MARIPFSLTYPDFHPLPLLPPSLNPLFAAANPLQVTRSTLRHVELGSHHVLAFKRPFRLPVKRGIYKIDCTAHAHAHDTLSPLGRPLPTLTLPIHPSPHPSHQQSPFKFITTSPLSDIVPTQPCHNQHPDVLSPSVVATGTHIAAPSKTNTQNYLTIPPRAIPASHSNLSVRSSSFCMSPALSHILLSAISCAFHEFKAAPGQHKHTANVI